MNIFLDCGFYSGQALKIYINKRVVNKTWTVYGFEANPEIAFNAEDFPVKVNLFRKAVWVKGGKLKFHISGRHDAAGIKDLTGHTDPKEIDVAAIDFSKFVAKLPAANIICSMDIEGAEFQVLEKMLKDNTIDRISILDVEFHHRFMNDYTHVEAQDLIKRIKARGVKVKLKVALQ